MRPGTMQARQLKSAGPLAAIAVTLAELLVGCQQVAPQPVELAARLDDPEAQIEHVMKRLAFALEKARAAANSGVQSRRRCDYELKPPAEGQSDYTADVVIETTVRLAAEDLAPQRRGPKGARAKPIGPVVDDELSEPTVTREHYKLAYRKGRWELVDPPQGDLGETEAICFQYALSDG